MQHRAKIQFSELEQSLMRNAEWILTKNAIMEKMKWLLQDCQDEQAALFSNMHSSLPAEIFITSAKISKGENYDGLPWLMLDYPRHFEKENSFAIRTLFWWGNFFSVTLHLSGKYKEQYAANIISQYDTLNQNDFYLCVNNTEWEHHFEKTNYIPVNKTDIDAFLQIINEKNFIKLSVKIDLYQWENLPEQVVSITKTIMEMLDQLPRR
ncbi:MAG: hypothetical protein E6H07_02395 [Bacteroidetes bacterium]|nr:MAG: hypothetical protein E6H07_02395 [Bacteroidota bacterium]